MKSKVWIYVLSAIGLIVLTGILFAPITTVSIKVDLPPVGDTRPDPVTNLRLGSGGRVWVNGKPTTLEQMNQEVAAAAKSRDPTTQRIVIEADSTISYKEFMAVMDRLQSAGYLKVSLLGRDAEP